jgi:hypothetical protein
MMIPTSHAPAEAPRACSEPGWKLGTGPSALFTHPVAVR